VAKRYYNFLLDKQMSRRDFFIFWGVAVGSVFPVWAVLTKLLSAHAESPFATTEAENGQLAGGAVIIDSSGASGGEAVQFNGTTTTTGGGTTPTWSEEFMTFDLITPSNPGGQWYSNASSPSSMNGSKDPAGSTWNANPNQTFSSVGALNPFTLGPVTDSTGAASDNNALTITCTPSTSAIQSATGYAAWGGTIVQNADVKYFTVGSYIEVRALFNGTGSRLWPAIWFFAADGVKSGQINSSAFQGAEVDLVEPQGNLSPGYTSMHMRQSGDQPNPNYQVNGSSDINGANFYGYPIVPNTWARYGFDWQTTGLTFYLNGKQVAQETNPVVMSYFNNAKMAFRLDYTLQSATSINSPVSMSTDYVREWPSFAASAGA
jgi:hypothetical protein